MHFQETTKISLLGLLELLKTNAIKSNVIARIPQFIKIEVNFDEDELMELESVNSNYSDTSNTELKEKLDRKIVDLFNFEDDNKTIISELIESARILFTIQNNFEDDIISVDYINEFSKLNIKLILEEVHEKTNLFNETEKYSYSSLEALIGRINNEISSEIENGISSINSEISEFVSTLEVYEEKLSVVQNLCDEILDLDPNNYFEGSLQSIQNFSADIWVNLDASDLLKPYLNDLSAAQGIELSRFIESLNKTLNEIS